MKGKCCNVSYHNGQWPIWVLNLPNNSWSAAGISIGNQSCAWHKNCIKHTIWKRHCYIRFDFLIMRHETVATLLLIFTCTNHPCATLLTRLAFNRHMTMLFYITSGKWITYKLKPNPVYNRNTSELFPVLIRIGLKQVIPKHDFFKSYTQPVYASNTSNAVTQNRFYPQTLCKQVFAV